MAGVRPAGAYHQRPARRPWSGRYPTLPGGLLAGHQGHRPRRLPDPGVRPLHGAGDGGPDLPRLRYRRQVPHARHGAGRRDDGPDDGACGAARRGSRASCPKTLGCQRPRRQARPQHHQLSVPDPEKLEQLVKERYERYGRSRPTKQMAEEYLTEDADIVLVAYGASSRVARSAVKRPGKRASRRAWCGPSPCGPSPPTGIARPPATPNFLVVEMSMGQMVDDVKLAIDCRCRCTSTAAPAA